MGKLESYSKVTCSAAEFPYASFIILPIKQESITLEFVPEVRLLYGIGRTRFFPQSMFFNNTESNRINLSLLLCLFKEKWKEIIP